MLPRSFKASHVPVREAFRKLEAKGFVISKPRCGVRVSQLDPGMVLEVTEMRAALEGLALHHALPRLDRSDLDAAHQDNLTVLMSVRNDRAICVPVLLFLSPPRLSPAS